LIQIKSLFAGKNNIRHLEKELSMTRILVADDDNDVRTALRVALEGEGYEVETVPDGERAMQVHENRPADVRSRTSSCPSGMGSRR
jgi:PleD family two-component response regulator